MGHDLDYRQIAVVSVKNFIDPYLSFYKLQLQDFENLNNEKYFHKVPIHLIM